MTSVKKLLIASGLVIVTSPLCFMVQAQDYIDLEAERAAAEAARGSSSQPVADPYGAKPAQAYPATSYGMSGAPAAPGGAVSPVATRTSGPPNGGQNLGNLFYQIQQLQQEVMRLNGRVEEQAHELRQLREQSRQRYVDLDKRLSEGGGTAPAASNGGSAAPVRATPVVSATVARSSAGAEQPGEGDAYQAAYGLVVGRQFAQAIPAFQQFLRDYPDGKYAPNAQYWLGELYLVSEPADLESARQAFALLISQYPENAKAPDALYKLGKVQFMKGNREKAREYLDLVISQYSGSNSAAVNLAKTFIAENY
jgi:tol-pal system protein YbgF